MGWAPLHPSVRHSGGAIVEVDVNIISPRGFVFVEERRFLEPVRPTTVIVNNTTIINKTVNITNIRVVNNTVINEGPHVDVVERTTGHKVQPVQVRDVRRRSEAEVITKHPTLAPARERSAPPPARTVAEPREKKGPPPAETRAKEPERKGPPEPAANAKSPERRDTPEPAGNAKGPDRKGPPEPQGNAKGFEKKGPSEAERRAKESERKGSPEPEGKAKGFEKKAQPEQRSKAPSDEASLAASVRRVLAADPQLRGVGVNTSKGGLGLTGTVSSNELKSRAADLARRVEGVRAIENNIGVSAESGPGEKGRGKKGKQQ